MGILSEFENMLDNFLSYGRRRSRKVIADDFNVWALEWANRENNTKGRGRLEVFAQLNIALANVDFTLLALH